MAIKDVKTELVDKMFTKGFMQGKSNNKKPDYFANIAKNVRLRNGGLTPRDGFTQLYTGTGNPVRGIVGNDKLYYCHDSKFKSLDLTTFAETNHGSIGTDVRCSFITYGKYTIILTGVGYPWVFDGTTLSQLTSSNITSGNNPSFGVRYAGFTVVNTTNDAKNVIKISRPITLANQTYSYNRDLTNGSESITYDSEVLGLESSINFLRVFTKNTIEKMTKDNLTTSGGIQSLFTIPIAKGQEVLNNNCIVSAGDKVFFVTSQKQIASIEYSSTNPVDPVFTIMSDRYQDGLDIQDRLDNLDDDQSNAFGIYDKKLNVIKWFFKSINGATNDKCLIYDITNNTFLEDDNKYFSCMCEFQNKYYAGGCFAGDIYQDEIGKNDNGEGIDWLYQTDMYLSSKMRKKRCGSGLSGVINYGAKIRRQIEVDDITEFDDYINGNNYISNDLGLGIGGSMVGQEPIGGLVDDNNNTLSPFNVRITESRLAGKGEKMTMIFSGNELEQDFVLDYLDISYKPLRTTETINKF